MTPGAPSGTTTASFARAPELTELLPAAHPGKETADAVAGPLGLALSPTARRPELRLGAFRFVVVAPLAHEKTSLQSFDNP